MRKWLRNESIRYGVQSDPRHQHKAHVERGARQRRDPGKAANTTSYGHNVELVWLLGRADEALARPRSSHDDVARRLVDHALTYGLDGNLGGMYRDGPPRDRPTSPTRNGGGLRVADRIPRCLRAPRRKNEYFDAFARNMGV